MSNTARCLHLRCGANADRALWRRLARVRADDLAAHPDQGARSRATPRSTWSQLDEVYFGCANQAGEDNRNVARMALLLAGLPDSIPGITVNRLCASGLNAVGAAARAIRSGEIDFAIAGGVESMTRAPFVMGKATEAFQRTAEIYDTTIGWRFINPLMKAQYGVDAMARDRRERRRGIPGVAAGPGRLCAALAAARRQGDGGAAISPRRSSPSRSPAARRARSRSTTTSIRGPTRRPSSLPSCAPHSAIRAR